MNNNNNNNNKNNNKTTTKNIWEKIILKKDWMSVKKVYLLFTVKPIVYMF
jgi:hypothetical protein